MKTLRQLLGERLKKLREASHLTEAQLAEITKKSRAAIYEIESGKKNITLDEFERVVVSCGWSPETLFSADASAIPHDLAWMLKTILDSKDPTLLDGIRVNLVAISRLARSLDADNPRGSPQRPPSREGQEPGMGANARSQTEPRLKRRSR